MSHGKEREHKTFTRRRELTTDYGVFGSRLRRGCFAPFNPIPDAHTSREEMGKKKIRRQRHKRLTYLSPRDILYMLKGDKVFRLTFEDYLPLFAPPRSTGLVFPVSAGFVNFPANVFSYVSPCPLQYHLSKRQRHRRLTSAAFGDIIKLQNRRGGSLPKGR